MTKKEADKIHQLAKIVESLAITIDTLIDSNIHLAKELKTHQDECISLCNRVNELELDMENKPKPLVMPVIRRNAPVEIATPYPKRPHTLSRVYNKLRRIVNAST